MVASMQVNAGSEANRLQLRSRISRMLANSWILASAGTPGGYDLRQIFSTGLLSIIVAIGRVLSRDPGSVTRSAGRTNNGTPALTSRPNQQPPGVIHGTQDHIR